MSLQKMLDPPPGRVLQLDPLYIVPRLHVDWESWVGVIGSAPLMGIDLIKLGKFPVRQPHPALFQPHAAPQHALGLVQF